MTSSARYIFGIMLALLLSLSVQATIGVDDCVKSTETLFRKEDQEVFFFKSYEIINGDMINCRTINGQLQVYPKDRDIYLPQEIIIRKKSTGYNGFITYEASAELPPDLVLSDVVYYCDHAMNMPPDVYILETCWVQYSLEYLPGKKPWTTKQLALIYSSIVAGAITVLASIIVCFTHSLWHGLVVLTWPIWLPIGLFCLLVMASAHHHHC